jgi:hypothetical protein
LQKLNDDLNIELGRVKGLLAREREQSEDFSVDKEIADRTIKVSNSLYFISINYDFIETRWNVESKRQRNSEPEDGTAKA